MKEMVTIPIKYLLGIVDQLVECNYTCEAGHIEHNVEFQKLAGIVQSVLEKEPLWELSPDWAQWWAMDKNGTAFWYEKEPSVGLSSWYPNDGDLDDSIDIHEEYEFWKDTLRQRPGAVVKSPSPALSLWDSAPEWARWFAVDGDGNAYWYKEEPQLNRAGERWLLNNDGIMSQKVPTKYPSDNWELSLRKRTLEVSDAPDWDSAPVWAEWYAVDDGGAAYYYEEEPSMGLTMWLPMRVGARSELANDELIPTLDWKSTLQERPT